MKLSSIAVSLFLLAGSAAAQDPPSRVARLNLLNGPVSFQPATVDDWTAATLNYPLTTGDHLYADQGARAEMHIGPNALRLNALTNFGFLNLDDRAVQMRLTEGNLEIRLRELPDADAWEVDTPNGAVSLLRTGDYRIDTDPTRNATMITVRSGEVEVTANGQSFPIRPGQTAYFTGDGSQQNVQSANPPDEFDGYCFDRDRREDTLPPPRYVSRSMEGYQDLEANGVWTETPDYGPVWRPRAVAVGWAPYHNGHWAWVEPWGWTWIDDAPWGFAPFHYGRWAYIGGGWGWCPGPVVVARPVYAPALVAFVGGGGWSASLGFGGAGVAWFPLGPREVFVPAYHVSPVYVRQVNVMNVTNINTINITNVNRVYVNQRVPGAVVAVSRTDFVGARSVARVAVRVDVNVIASARVSEVPGVAPERVSVFGRAGGAVAVARPAPAVFNRPVIARATPPPPPVQFAAKQQALEANGGRPIDPAVLHTMRQSQPEMARPAVRMASQPGSPAVNGGFGRQGAAPPVQTNNNFGRPASNGPAAAPAVQDRMYSRPPSASTPAPRPAISDQTVSPERMNARPVAPNAAPAVRERQQMAQPVQPRENVQPRAVEQRAQPAERHESAKPSEKRENKKEEKEKPKDRER